MILAFVLNLLVLQDRSSITLVAIADQSLATGSPLDTSTLRLVPVETEFEGLPNLVTEEELGELAGWVLSRPVAAGELVQRSAFVEPGTSGLRSMSLPVPPEHAAGGSLVTGDRVDVISVVDESARYVASDLEVISVSDGPASGGLGAISVYHVVVTVDADEALRLAEALDVGSVEIVRSTGSDVIEEEVADGS